MEDKEIGELRKRIDRLEWLLTIITDRQSIEAIKGALSDAKQRLEELLKKRDGRVASEASYLYLQAQRIAGLASRSPDRRLAQKLKAISWELLARAETLHPDKRRCAG